MTGDPRVSLSVLAAKDAWFAGEAIELDFRISIDRAFVNENMVQPFARRLDVPVRLSASWLEALPGASAGSWTRLPETSAGSTLVVNDGVLEAARAVDDLTGAGRTSVIDLVRTYFASSPGELAIPAARLEFAYATRFEEDALSGRVAKDRIDAFVRSEPLALKILPIPEEDRPPEFTGAVGRFSIAAELDKRVVELGDSLKLELRIEGQGNIDAFAAPQARELTGFHVRGVLNAKDGGRRVITYDIAPIDASASEVPAIAFAYFDTREPARYRVAKTQPIPIEIRSSVRAPDSERAGAASSPRTRSEPRAAEDGARIDPDPASHRATLAIGCALALSIVAAIVFVRRRFRGGGRDRMDGDGDRP